MKTIKILPAQVKKPDGSWLGGDAFGFGSGKKDFVTPQMYGAKGDGITDDSVAFQAMVNACEYGDKIFIPKGDYCIKNVRVKNQISISGIGLRSRIFLHPSATEGDAIFILDGNSTGSELFDSFVLDGNSENVRGTCHGIYAQSDGQFNKYNGLFNNLVIRNFTGDGIRAECNMMEYTITSCRIRKCRNGAYFANFMDSRISDCTFSSCKVYGLRLCGSTVKMVNTKCFMNGDKDNGCGLYLSGIHHSLANVEIQENYYDGAVLDNTSKSYIQIVLNCNNHRDSVGSCQLRLKDSYENKIDAVISGGYMFQNPVPILEKTGVVEEGASFKNYYNIVFCSNKNHTLNTPNIMNPIRALYDGAVSSKYYINGDEWLADDTVLFDMNSVGRTVSYCDNGSATVKNKNVAIATGLCKYDASYRVLMRCLGFSSALSGVLPTLKRGDIIQVSAFVKNNVNAKLMFDMQFNLNGSYKKLTEVRAETSKSNEYDMITAVYEVPNGYDEKVSAYNIDCAFSLSSDNISVPIGTEIEVEIKNIKVKVTHL